MLNEVKENMLKRNKKRKSQQRNKEIEILYLKKYNIVNKNFTNGVEMSEKRVSKLEDKLTESIQYLKERKKVLRKKKF